MNEAGQLSQGLAELNIALAPDAPGQLLHYLELLRKWNRVHNLTSIGQSAAMVSNHLLDSLAAAPHLNSGRVLDVGSGGGLPGIPLAVAWPEAAVTLIDANHKKTAFLRQAVIELGLRNVTVECARVEAWRSESAFDVVISRALCDLAEFVALAGHLCAADGVIASMKGIYPTAELAQLPPEYRLRQAIALRVPGLASQRHLILVERLH